MVIEKTESKLGSVEVGSVAFMTLAFVFFMMGATFILISKLVGVYVDNVGGDPTSLPSYSIFSTLVALIVAMVALVVLNFGAFFNGQKELNAILMGFVVTLLVAVLILAAWFGLIAYDDKVEELLIFESDFSMPAYIAALFMLIGGILLFFKRGNFKIIGTTYVLGALMYVFFARAIQIISSATFEGTGFGKLLLDAQTPLVIAGVFAIVAGILALYIGVSKTNVIKAPLA